MLAERKDDRVVIAGAGPVGLTAALSLARLGVSVTVLEAGQALNTESRASTFHPSSLEILSELGILTDVLAQGLVAPTVQYRGRTEGLIAELDYSLLSTETPYPYRIQLEQSKVTPLLLAALLETGLGEIRFDHTVTGVRQDTTGVDVSVRSPQGDITIRAPYVIGSDGGSSAVRTSMGIEFQGAAYPERFLVMSTTYDLSQLWDNLANVSYFSDRAEWMAIIRTPDHWRITIPIRSDADAAFLDSPVNRQQKLRELTGHEVDIPIVHTNVYRVSRLVADRFSEARVFLAGDAAHLNNPTGGLGMNSGILDAHFLARDLVQAFDGHPRALTEYGPRQRAMALNVVGHYSNATWAALSERDEAARDKWKVDIARLTHDPVAIVAYLRELSLLNALDDLRAAS